MVEAGEGDGSATSVEVRRAFLREAYGLGNDCENDSENMYASLLGEEFFGVVETWDYRIDGVRDLCILMEEDGSLCLIHASYHVVEDYDFGVLKRTDCSSGAATAVEEELTFGPRK